MTKLRVTLALAATAVGSLLAVGTLPAAARSVFSGGHIYWRSIRDGDQIRPRFHSVLSDWDWKHLHWSRWNARVAKGRGVAVHQLGGPVDERDLVQIRLSQVKRCPDGARIYTRIHVTWHYSTGTRRYTWSYACKPRDGSSVGAGGG